MACPFLHAKKPLYGAKSKTCDLDSALKTGKIRLYPNLGAFSKYMIFKKEKSLEN
jgi:hypothetical protein